MAQVGRKRFIPFRVADMDGAAVTGRVLTDFAVTFLRDGAACNDPLTVVEQGAGLYFLTYTPSGPGQDYIELYDAANDVRVGDDEYVAEDLNVVNLSPALDDSLKPAVANPQTFTLYVFDSQTWQSGDHDPLSAEASTLLDADGNWLTVSLPVLHGTYHVVLMNGTGEIHVIRTFLTV